MIEQKEYIVDKNIILKPISNDEEIVHEYIIKMHIYHNSIDNISPVKDVKKFKKMKNSVFWMINYKNKIVGFLNLVYRNQCIDNALEIHRFFIDNEYRKYGIGSRVINLLKLLAKEKGYSEIVAKIYCDNPAISFYENNGFETYYRYMVANIKE